MDNQRNSWIAGVVVLLIIIVGGVYLWRSNANPGNSTATTTPSGSTMMLPYGRTTLGIDQEGVFRGITIRPLSVAEDSRCGAGVQCIQAGTVRVVVRSDLGAGSSRQDTVALGSTTPVSTFTISLISVEPSAKAGAKIADKDYRFTFEVHQNGDGSGLEGKG
ncbi:hypothetical protein KW799_02025 [Candidatus Parcubacteria bacterium]|nr:hypothetical protein [Candidatus Parcubacteria bacterium]